MLGVARKLWRHGILGINARNNAYIFANNPRRRFPLVNDKLKTKKLASAAGIRIPELYAVIKAYAQTRRLDTLLAGRDRFVIKPACGAQGNGIVVIDGRLPNAWRRSNGSRMPTADLAFHVSNILAGMYSLGGHHDRAIIEYRIEPDPFFDPISYQGVPDIRILVFHGVPVMAMLRVPTRQSDGKANLHKGGVGIGVKVATGRTTSGVQHERIAHEHPETGHTVAGLIIPSWDEVLDIASHCYDLTGLGCLGVDVVIDRTAPCSSSSRPCRASRSRRRTKWA